MTIVSLQLLADFLSHYNPKGRIADYGGTEKIGAEIVIKMLGLSHIHLIKEGTTDLHEVTLRGIEKTPIATYHPLDFDNGYDLRQPVKGKKFDAGICMDLLEHTSNPFVVAKNIKNSLKRGALLFVTVPWVWEIHYYPKDYWRFAPQGLEELFLGMEVLEMQIIRDEASDEELPRHRLVAIFKKH